MKGHRQLIADKTYHVQSFDPVMDPHVIVGTIPSITSHGLKVYYGHASNSFWWIAGEALGFRRGGPFIEKPWPDQFQSKPAKDILSEVTKRTDDPILD